MKEEQLVIKHFSDGERQAVAAALHVLVLPSDCGGFFAQGLEIDYVATGRTEEEAREHFARGFIATVRSYLTRERELGALLSKSKTPDEYWRKYFAGTNQHIFGCVFCCDVRSELELPPDSPIPGLLRFCSSRSDAAIPA